MIERITLTGREQDRAKAFAYCEKYKLRIIRSGPHILADHTAQADSFKIIAEREVASD